MLATATFTYEQAVEVSRHESLTIMVIFGGLGLLMALTIAVLLLSCLVAPPRVRTTKDGWDGRTTEPPYRFWYSVFLGVIVVACLITVAVQTVTYVCPDADAKKIMKR